MTSILIIEDDVRIASNIEKRLVAEGWNVDVVHDGLEGKEVALANHYELILLDVNLPNMKGIEVCGHIRTVKPTLPIIMLTAHGEIEDKVVGLESGADDYIVKPFDFRELIARIKVNLRRIPQQYASEILEVSDLTLNVTSKTVVRNGTPIELTAREFALLEYMLRNRGKTLSKMDLAENVWQLKFDPGTNVVEVYINYLRRKIDRDYPNKLIHTRPGLGYVLN